MGCRTASYDSSYKQNEIKLMGDLHRRSFSLASRLAFPVSVVKRLALDLLGRVSLFIVTDVTKKGRTVSIAQKTINPAAVRYVAYYRVSTAMQGKSGLGIGAQQETVKRFLAGEGGGWPPVASFTEHESGKRNNRPELAKALAVCRSRRATLVVAKVDRLARSQSFLESLRASGVDIRFCDLPDVKGATGKFLLAQMAAVAELEAGLIGERTKAALAAKVARDGQWDRKSKHHLVPGAGQAAAARAVSDQADKRAADLAEYVRDIRSKGITSHRAIAKALNADNVATARGGVWQSSNVRKLLARIQG